MDIFNRAPAISEDTLQYKLYPSPEEADRASVTSLAARITSFVDSILPNIIWHRDAFELKVVADPDLKEKWMLEGLMRVGDSVDDEWCVVWLLKEVSKKWDVAIRYVYYPLSWRARCGGDQAFAVCSTRMENSFSSRLLTIFHTG